MTDGSVLYLKFKQSFKIPYIRTRNIDGSWGIEPDPNAVSPEADLGLAETGLVFYDNGSGNYAARPLEAAYNPSAITKNLRVLSQAAAEELADNYIPLATPAEVSVQHTFNAGLMEAPFLIGANSYNIQVDGLNADTLRGLNPAYFLSRANHGGLFPYCIVSTAGQAIPDVAGGAATYDIEWTTEVVDTGNFWTNATPARLTAPANGLYIVGALVAGSGGAGEKRLVSIESNSSQMIGVYSSVPPFADAVPIPIYYSALSIGYMAAGQYASVYVAQDTGGNLNIGGSQAIIIQLCDQT